MPNDDQISTPSTPASAAAPARANEQGVLASEGRGSFRVDALPMKFTFEFTGDCNLHCFFCDCEFGRNEFRKRGVTKFSMDEATFRTLAENAFPKATVVNPTVVGEPFTFPYFDLMLEYCEKYGTKLEIITNGMLLKGPRVERLLPLLDRLTISFDGGTKETFEKCRTGSKFDVVIKNLRDFRDRRRALGLESQVKFSFGVTLMRENIEEFPRIVEWARDLDATEVCAAHLLVFTKELKSSSLFQEKELSNRMIAAARKRAVELGVKLEAPAPFDVSAAAGLVGTDLPAFDGRVDDEQGFTGRAPRLEHTVPLGQAPRVTETEPKPELGASAPAKPSAPPIHLAHESPAPDWAKDRYWCKFAWREAFILHSGDVAPCCHQGRPVMGNVFRQPWDEIWNGEAYQAIRRGLYDKQPTPFCSTCSLLAEQGHVPYSEEGYIFDDRYPEQSRADRRPPKEKPTPPA